jgi:transposase InsO family protein
LKLERWKIYTFGIIDGYSRRIMGMCVSDNMRAQNPIVTFLDAAQRFGLPERIRGDKGQEHRRIVMLMFATRMVQSCVRLGRSVHNIRIERLWRDYRENCVEYHRELFFEMEQEGILSVDNDIDLLALKLVFLPVIRQKMEQFMNSWNHHRGSFGVPNVLWEMGPKDENNYRELLAQIPIFELDLDYTLHPNINDIYAHIIGLNLRDQYLLAREILNAMN